MPTATKDKPKRRKASKSPAKPRIRKKAARAKPRIARAIPKAIQVTSAGLIRWDIDPPLPTLADLVKPYRAAEGEAGPPPKPAPGQAQRARVLVGNGWAQRVLAAWSSLPSTWAAPGLHPPEDDRERWDWIWEGLEYSVADLAMRAGLSESVTEDMMELLAGNRLAFPDGTIGMWGRGILEAAVKKGAK